MKRTPFTLNTQASVGFGLIVAGVLTFALGHRELLTMALAPVGVGLVLSDIVARTKKSLRERVKVRVRHNNNR